MTPAQFMARYCRHVPDEPFFALYLEAMLRKEHVAGIRLAASVAADYDKYSSHKCLVSDCILAKLNVPGMGKPRRNPALGAVVAADRLQRVLRALQRAWAALLVSHRNCTRAACGTCRARKVAHKVLADYGG